MKHFFIVFLFLLIPFSFPFVTLAQTATPVASPTAAATSSASSSQPSFWTRFWNWIMGIFIKTDYTISQRPPQEVNSDMNDYGEASASGKHSSSGTRLTDTHSQTCYKGTVIKKVILKAAGYPDSDLAHICLNSANQCSVSSNSNCQLIKISDLAQYLIQTNQQFYCDDQNKLIDSESNVVSAVESYIKSHNLSAIPSTKLSCYQDIYQDFYLVPKDTSDTNEENSKKIVQTPVSASDQDPEDNANDIKNKLNENFSPDGTSAGLNNLRPASW